jgi:hypothetical protein
MALREKESIFIRISYFVEGLPLSHVPSKEFMTKMQAKGTCVLL